MQLHAKRHDILSIDVYAAYSIRPCCQLPLVNFVFFFQIYWTRMLPPSHTHTHSICLHFARILFILIGRAWDKNNILYWQLALDALHARPPCVRIRRRKKNGKWKATLIESDWSVCVRAVDTWQPRCLVSGQMGTNVWCWCSLLSRGCHKNEWLRGV